MNRNKTTTTTTTPESRARLAYCAYGKAAGFVNKDGNPLPMFDNLPKKTRLAWEAAAELIWDLANTGRAGL
jgi:hypothetical protein